MNDEQPLSTAPLPPRPQDNRLTAETYEEFVDSLDILYLKGNLSGRLKFLENWPDAGQFIFGDELIDCDYNGTNDYKRREALEEEAEERRINMLEIAQTLEEKSVDKSALQLEYVENLVKELGRDLSLLLYAPHIVDRFIEPPSKDAPVSDDVEKTAKDSPVSGDALQTSQSDIAAFVDDIAPKSSAQGAPSASNPIIDEPENPDIKKPTLDDIDEHLDSIEPISVDPPAQRPVPDDIQQEAAQQNPVLSPEPGQNPAPEAPKEPENAFLGRSPYDREEEPLPPPSAQSEQGGASPPTSPSIPLSPPEETPPQGTQAPQGLGKNSLTPVSPVSQSSPDSAEKTDNKDKP